MKAIIFDLFETLVTENQLPTKTPEQTAVFLGAEPGAFAAAWKEKAMARKTGKCTTEEALFACCPPGVGAERVRAELLRRRKRLHTLFENPNGEALLLLSNLKRRGCLLGVVSNCDNEEAAAWRRSLLAVYPDALALSSETGLCKPDPAAYLAVSWMLGVRSEDCLYVGDGGNEASATAGERNAELTGAAEAGMKPLRAAWFCDRKTGGAEPVLNRFSDLYRYL